MAVVWSQWNCDEYKGSHSRPGVGTVVSDMTVKDKFKKLFSLTERFKNAAIWQSIQVQDNDFDSIYTLLNVFRRVLSYFQRLKTVLCRYLNL